MKTLRCLLIGLLSAVAVASPASATDPVALPVIEVPATANARPEAPLMIFMTGDGGWAAFVREISMRLAAEGWSVVGLNLREYLSTRRTPEETAAAVDSLIGRYREQWHRDRVVIAGFSRGADLAAFVVNRLPAPTRAQVTVVVMLSPGRQAGFEFHFADFMRKPPPETLLPVADEVARLGETPVLILRGDKDEDALDLPVAPGRVIKLPGDHHLGRDYPTITRFIEAAAHTRLSRAPEPSPSR